MSSALADAGAGRWPSGATRPVGTVRCGVLLGTSSEMDLVAAFCGVELASGTPPSASARR